MEYVTCKDSVMELIDEGTAQFGPSYRVSKEVIERVSKICEEVDRLVPTIDCEYVDVSIDERTKELTITVACDELILPDGRNGEFFDLIAMLDSFSFKKQGREFMRMDFNVSGVWEHMCG